MTQWERQDRWKMADGRTAKTNAQTLDPNRSLFWINKSSGLDRGYWYSPVFNRLCLEVPEQTSGGFLAEEMVSVQ